MFENLFGHKHHPPELLHAVEHAVSCVEPLLRQASGYPDAYLAPVSSALEYARTLANALPGPVTVNRETYASDPLVHALFPSVESIAEAIYASQALQEHLREFPGDRELYALMGARRIEKAVVGMQLSGQIVQHDVVQNMVYFTSHTIEAPASTETQARAQVAMSFFDHLVAKVAQRIARRKQVRQELLQEKDVLIAKLRTAEAQEHDELKEKLARLMERLQIGIGALELEQYPEYFASILLKPEQHLWLEQTSIKLDSMGVRRDDVDAAQGKTLVFNELIGYDRRNWTAAIVRCSDIPRESFANRLEQAYRTLTI